MFQIKVNPYTKMPYSKKYWQIWEKRHQLPVWEYKEKFMEVLHNNQCTFDVSFANNYLMPLNKLHFCVQNFFSMFPRYTYRR